MDEFLELKDGRKLSFRQIKGKKKTTVVFMHGTLSDKNASKSLFLEQICQENGLGYVAFDFIGHGNSSGQYTDGTIGLWLENAFEIIDRVISGPVVVVGSSMGGWIGLLSAVARPKRIKAFIGLAAAPDFTVDLWHSFTEDQKQTVNQKGVVYIPNGWTEEGDPWTKELFMNAEKYLLLKENQAIDITCPVTLIHGAKDDCVPVETSFKTMGLLKTENVKVIVLKNSGHRLSEPNELLVLKQELLTLLL